METKRVAQTDICLSDSVIQATSVKASCFLLVTMLSKGQ